MRSKCILNILSIFILIVGVLSTSQSPLDKTDRIRFTIVNVEILVLSVPSLLPVNGIENVVLATQVFLESSLNIHPTTINEMQVAITSQSFNGGVEVREANNSTSFVLSVDLQLLLEYQLAAGDARYSDMDRRIRTLFSEEWDELQALLKLLDPAFFGSVHTIALKPKPHIQPENPVFHGGAGGQLAQSQSRKPAPTVIIIFLVIGIGVAISLLTVFPLFFLKSANRYVVRMICLSSTRQCALTWAFLL
jgi:hypothetical protein